MTPPAEVTDTEDSSARADELPGESQMPSGSLGTAARKLWKNHSDKVMYLVAGGFNTLFSYGCFAFFYYLLHEYVPSSGVLVISYVVASVVGFLTLRYLVFSPVSHPLAEYLRYHLVYAPLLVVQTVVLPLVLKYSDLNAYFIQAMWIVPAVLLGYLGSKYFTFRKRRKDTAENDNE